jgi:photosystem II stability/assembly factor-like uncharacterized protein
MKGQFSRLTARRARRYSSVRLQQGRVHLDADFNEQVDIADRRDRFTTRDVIGRSGVPLDGGGFALSAVVSLTGLDIAGTSARAVGRRGTVLASADGGTTWTMQAVPAGVAEHDVLAVDVFDANTAMATTASGEVLLQTNGVAWTVQTPADAAGSAIRGVQLLSAAIAWIVGDDGLILGTANAGGVWVKRAAAGVTETLHAAHFPTAASGWAVGDAGRIVASADSGATWAAQATPAGFAASLLAVRFAPDALHGWAVGDGAAILSTADGGVTWIVRTAPPGVDATLRGLDVVSTTTAWAVGDSGTVLRTVDGGATWSLIAPSAAIAVADLSAVVASAAATARVAGDLSTLANVSISGGVASWTASPTLPGRDLAVSVGRMYVDGVLCENDRPSRYLAQPDLIGVVLPGVGTYRAYLDVWARHLTSLERPELREVALGGPDTATRTQTVWQVRIDPAVLPASTRCADVPEGWEPGSMATGRMRARGAPSPLSTDDCLVPAGGGYRRLENLLYRVEIHTPGAPGVATFKWSRDNGSVAGRLTATDPAPAGKTVTIADAGHARDGDFAGAAWVELTDDRRILNGEPGVLLQVAGVTGTVIKLQTAPPAMSQFGPGAVVRRWDGTRGVVAGGWMGLATTDAATPEDGIDVEFGPGDYLTGDHWTIPARTLVGDVEWPREDGTPTFLTRDGDEHRFAALAIVAVDATGGVTVVEDCRTIFPPLGGLETLLYVSGDGQEVARGGALQLPDPVVVGVTRGPIPVRDARVRFRVGGGGAINGLTPENVVLTSPEGLAQVTWILADTVDPQHVTAELIDGADAPLGTPVRFQARVRSAASVSYDPSCPDLAGATTVQAAIDALCKRPAGEGGGCCHTVGKTDDEAGEYPDIITAVKDLIGRKHRDICLCLLPGEYRVPTEELRGMLKEAEVKTLEIGGRGAVIVLDTPQIFENLAWVTLRDLSIQSSASPTLMFLDGRGESPDQRMRVDMVDVTISAADAARDAALVQLEGVGRARITGSSLSITPKDVGFRLSDLLPAAIAGLFESATTANPAQLRASLGKLLTAPDAERFELADVTRKSVEERPDVFDPARMAVMDRFSEQLRTGEAALPALLEIPKLRLEWSDFAKGFAGGERGWPAAILFLDTATDASVEGSRVTGGVAFGGGDRDLASEVRAESPFRFHDVEQVPDGSGRLRLDGNVVDWVSLGAAAARSLAEQNGSVRAAELQRILFAEMLVTNNTFRDAPHIFLATAATVHGNIFERAVSGAEAPRLGFVGTAVASATGDLGPDRRSLGSDRNAELVLHGDDRAEAGNARLTII